MKGPNYIRLSELSFKIEGVIKDAFQFTSFWVIADVTSHTYKQSSDYHHFELVEKDKNSNHLLAKFSARSWGMGARQIERFEQITGQKFTDNIQVLVNVLVDFHPLYGLQLQVTDVDVNFTLGVIEQQRQATLAKLVLENATFIWKIDGEYITKNKKLNLNHVIQSIAVISSSSSAGLQDFKHTLVNNPFSYYFKIDEYFTGVQGEANALALRNKLIEVYKSGVAYDAVVITRGGGSQTDFMIFDNYLVGQAIAKFPVPVITGLGHQKNTSIADLMAHTQTKTPTKSAEFIIAHNRAFEEEMLNFQKSLVIKSQQMLSFNFKELSSLNSTIVNKSRDILNEQKDLLSTTKQVVINTTRSILFQCKTDLQNNASKLLSKPKIMVGQKKNELQSLVNILRTANTYFLKKQRDQLGYYVSLIKLVSPDQTLKRGFAIVKHNDQVVRNADALKAGENISVILSGQELKATVNSKTKYDGKEFDL